MIWIALLTGGIYMTVIAFFLYGWEKLIHFNPDHYQPNTFVTIVIPMRNEQDNIAGILNSLRTQHYTPDLYEIIVIDDHSSDLSFQKALCFQKSNVRILSLPENVSGKKAALRYGIEAACGDLIITTDADCYVGSNWIKCIAEYYEKYSPLLILGPVLSIVNKSKDGVFTQMQALELFSLAGSTAGAAAIGHPIMCNGANLAFSKVIYPEIRHVYDNGIVSSGDDMFLLIEMKKIYFRKIHFLKSKEATVYTDVTKDLPSFIRQRKRWAAKARFYKDYETIITALIVLGTNILLLVFFAIGLISHNFSYFLILFLLKSVVDFLFLYRVTDFFEQKRLMKWFPIVQSFYFLYVCFTALTSITTSVTWKERVTKY